MSKLTLERLKDLLELNLSEGRFYWKQRRAGRQAGTFDSHGYGQIKIDGVFYREHRLIWLYITGAWPCGQIDHINHQRRDNRFENLREATPAMNATNLSISKRNTSGFVGVSLQKSSGQYVAYICVNGKILHLGSHKDFESAMEARRAANIQYGYHCNHGVGVGGKA